MHPNEELLITFYSCFQNRDATGMTECYAPGVVFSDPVFQSLNGKRANAMWHMLLKRSKDFELTFRDVQADDQKGTAHWEARYTYSATGRKVLNIVEAQFQFQDGKIIVHHDTFDLWKWAAQALGMNGKLLGWTPFVQKAIRQGAAQTLDTYIARKGDNIEA